MKKHLLLPGMLLALLLLGSPSMAAEKDNALNYEWNPLPITVHVDGSYLPCDVDPIIKNGRTLLPLRAAGEALDAKVEWLPQQQAAHLSKDGKNVYFFLNSKTFTVNGQSFPLDCAPMLVKNRTMIPLRAFGEALGATVDWRNALRDVTIDTPAPDATAPEMPDGISADAARFIEKYYVPDDSTDAFVGSWRSEPEQFVNPWGMGNYNQTHYHFISKYNDIYQCIHIGIENADWYDNHGSVVEKLEAWTDNHALMMHKMSLDDVIYHRVPGNGYSNMLLMGVGIFKLEGPHLMKHGEYINGDLSFRQIIYSRF